MRLRRRTQQSCAGYNGVKFTNYEPSVDTERTGCGSNLERVCAACIKGAKYP